MTTKIDRAVDQSVHPSRNIGLHDWVWLAGLSLVLAALYAWQLQPGIAPHGDISKFQFAAALGGTVHQSGYPLYLMLGWLAARLPIVNAATAVTMLSALFGVGTVAFTYSALREMRCRPPIAAAFSLMLGVAPVVFYYAVVAEVYSAHLFFMAGVLAMLLRWRRTGSDVDLGFAIVLLAFSFTNHMSMAFLVPGILWFVWKTDRTIYRRPGVWLFGVASLALAMGTYGYLIWRAGDPATPFVEVAPETWFDLIPIWVGSGGTMLVLGPERIGEMLRRIPDVGLDVARHTLLALPLAAFGFKELWRDAAGTMLAWWLAVSFAFAVVFASPNPQSFVPPLVLVVMVTAAVGTEWLIARYLRSAIVIAIMAVLVAAVSVGDGMRFVAFQSGDDYERRVRAWYSDVPPDGVLAAGYTDAMAALYLTLLDGARSDVVTISDYPLDDPASSVMGRYLAGEAVTVPHTRDVLEPGRALFAPGKSWACDLADAGFGIEPVTAELFRVLPLGASPDAPVDGC